MSKPFAVEYTVSGKRRYFETQAEAEQLVNTSPSMCVVLEYNAETGLYVMTGVASTKPASAPWGGRKDDDELYTVEIPGNEGRVTEGEKLNPELTSINVPKDVAEFLLERGVPVTKVEPETVTLTVINIKGAEPFIAEQLPEITMPRRRLGTTVLQHEREELAALRELGEAQRDALLTGRGYTLDGKRIDPKDVVVYGGGRGGRMPVKPFPNTPHEGVPVVHLGFDEATMFPKGGFSIGGVVTKMELVEHEGQPLAVTDGVCGLIGRTVMVDIKTVNQDANHNAAAMAERIRRFNLNSRYGKMGGAPFSYEAQVYKSDELFEFLSKMYRARKHQKAAKRKQDAYDNVICDELTTYLGKVKTPANVKRVNKLKRIRRFLQGKGK